MINFLSRNFKTVTIEEIYLSFIVKNIVFILMCPQANKFLFYEMILCTTDLRILKKKTEAKSFL